MNRRDFVRSSLTLSAGAVVSRRLLAQLVPPPAPGRAYQATPLRPRVGPADGGKLFEILSPDECGANISNQYSDPRMWAERFRELTLGAVETGIAVADFDKTGLPSLFVVSRDGPCALYRQSAPFKFVDVAAPAGVDCTGSTAGKTSATVVDIDQDGWPDFIVTRNNDRALIYRNQRLPGHNSFAIALRGQRGNPTAVGARVRVVLADGTAQTSEVFAGSGYLSQSTPVQFFGFLDGNPPREIEVRWPDGRTSVHPGGRPSGKLVLAQPSP